MKTLYIARHAKTIHGGHKIKDFDRYLMPQGKSDTRNMARVIKENQILPQMIISSPAKRAKQTTEIFCEIFNNPLENVVENESIYFGGISDFINIFENLDNKFDSVMLIGHNPTVHETTNYLINTPIHHFPTCSVAGLQFDIDSWIEIKAKAGKLEFFETANNIN